MALRSKLQKSLSGFAGKSILSLFVKVFGALGTYVFLLVFANLLGAEQFGIFAFVLSVANFGMLAFGFGQPMMTLRTLSFALSEDRPDLALGGLRFGIRLSLVGALLGAGLMLVFGQIAPQLGAPDAPGIYLAGAVLLMGLIGAEFLSHILRSFGAVASALLPKDVLWRVFSILSLWGLAVWGWRLDAADGVWLAAAVLGMLVLAQALYGQRLMPIDLRQAQPDKSDITAWRKASLHFWGIAAASGLVQHLTVVAVGFQMDPEEIGAFFAAFRTASLLSMPLTAANIVLAPMIAKHYKAGKSDLTQKSIREFIILAAVPSVLGLLGLVIYGDSILALFQPNFVKAHPALIIFALGFLINTLTGPCGYVMMMTGAESIFLRYTLVANIASVLGAGIMIGAGMEWAAIAIVLASIGQNIAAAIWSRRNAGVEATILCLWSRPNPPSV